MADLIKIAEEAFATGKEHPQFKAGDTVTVAYKIVEGNKERIQQYRGVVIKISGHQNKKRFTVRKMSGTVGVERIFPINSPNIDSIVVNKIGKVRRAKLYYLRKLTGKRPVSQKSAQSAATNKPHTFQNHTASESISHEGNFPTLIFYALSFRKVRPDASPRP